jgi:nicotinamide-nucleotide adenylyltransferase
MRIAFVGRFQPFHLGHKHVLEQFKEHDIVIVIGNGESRTQENPLSFEEREEIIDSCVENDIVTLENFESDEEWVEKLVEKTGAEAVVSRNEWTIEAVQKSSDLEVLEQEFEKKDLYSGTEIRRRIRSGEEWSYLVPECARDKISEYSEIFKKTGPQYEFDPGWKKENAYHGTADE